MKILIFSFFLLISYTIQASYMIRCYEKDAVSYRITMDFTTDLEDNLAIWRIYLHLPGDSILLDKYVSDKFYKEDILYDGELNKHIIIGDVIILNLDVYIIMTRLDNIYLMKYHLLPDEKKVLRSTHHIEVDKEVLFDRFGPRYFKASLKQISPNQLWVTWYRYNLLWFDCSREEGFRIVFEEEVEKKTGTLPDDMDGRPAEIVAELKRVLKYPLDKKNTTFQYVGYMDETDVVPAMKYWRGKRGEGITYFFYKKDINQPLKVIRYSNDNKVWLFSGYKEKEIPKNRFIDELEYKDIN